MLLVLSYLLSLSLSHSLFVYVCLLSFFLDILWSFCAFCMRVVVVIALLYHPSSIWPIRGKPNTCPLSLLWMEGIPHCKRALSVWPYSKTIQTETSAQPLYQVCRNENHAKRTNWWSQDATTPPPFVRINSLQCVSHSIMNVVHFVAFHVSRVCLRLCVFCYTLRVCSGSNKRVRARNPDPSSSSEEFDTTTKIHRKMDGETYLNRNHRRPSPKWRVFTNN